MLIKVEIDDRQVVALTQKVLRKLPYILNDSVTETAKLVVSAERFELARDFQTRKNFLQNRFKVLQYSRVTNLTAIVGVDTNVQGSPLLLGFFEDGGTKEPEHGPDLAVPITGQPERPSFTDPIPSGLRYKNLQITGGRGKKATFVIPGVGVFQRVGPYGRVWDKQQQKLVTVNRGATQILYAFRSSAPLHARTHMISLAQTVIGDSFARIFNKNFVREILGR